MSTAPEHLTALSDANLVEQVYSARTTLSCLRDMRKGGYSLSRSSRQSLHSLRTILPLLEVEVERRGLALPHWVPEGPVRPA